MTRVMNVFSIIIIINVIITNINGQCSWEVSGQTLDLSCLEAKGVITGEDDANPPHKYSFSVCANTQSCDNENVMVGQEGTQGADGQCFILGRYESNIQPEYSDDNGGTWTFEYRNGADGCGPPPEGKRTWKPKFICNSETEYSMGQVTETDCLYMVDITTKYACTDKKYSCDVPSSGSESDSDLSGGYIFIICFGSALFLYCIVGYIIMATTVNKEGGFGDFSNNIPNRTLWVKLIPLTLAGCAVTKEFIMGLINKGEGSDKEGALIATDDTGDEN